jgi:hypothetical protein
VAAAEGGPRGLQEALEKDVRDWIATWNTDPRPYVWAKTTDEILERLASYVNMNS